MQANERPAGSAERGYNSRLRGRGSSAAAPHVRFFPSPHQTGNTLGTRSDWLPGVGWGWGWVPPRTLVLRCVASVGIFYCSEASGSARPSLRSIICLPPTGAAGRGRMLRPAQKATREVPTMAAERNVKRAFHKQQLEELWQQKCVEPEQLAAAGLLRHAGSSSAVS